MLIKTNLTEVGTLETYQIVLQNAENIPEIAETITEMGYDGESILEGKKILAEALNAYNKNRMNVNSTSAAYSIFSGNMKLLEGIYRVHRKKAKIVFKKDIMISQKLAIVGAIPLSYVKKLETIKKFYRVVSSEEEIQSELSRLKIIPEDISYAQTLIQELEASRISYLKEKGESQDATIIKDAAFAKMKNWMSEFYAVAKIALKDKPQILESLLTIVKS